MRRLFLLSMLALSRFVVAQPGDHQMNEIVKVLKGQRVALVVNHTSVVGKTHLIDTLLKRGVHIVKIFAPEHGLRGNAADGDLIKDGVDTGSGLPIVSLYGNSNKPTAEQLADVDKVVFDIEDVGVRFFTFISTMHKVMEACAEHKKTLVILDRPDPNGYVDGPVLDPSLKSFVGMHPIPIVHGLTVGELAQMINGEKWLEKGMTCPLEIIKVKNWKHGDPWHVAIRPSPNLPNDQAIRLYPSLGLFEGTVISVGRGTQIPFNIIGNPLLTDLPYQFTPISIEGMSTSPPHKDVLCYGLDLRQAPIHNRIDLSYILDMYKRYPDKEKFFIPYFEKLAGNKQLREQIKQGKTEEEIRASWKPELDTYLAMRKKYLLYP